MLWEKTFHFENNEDEITIFSHNQSLEDEKIIFKKDGTINIDSIMEKYKIPKTDNNIKINQRIFQQLKQLLKENKTRQASQFCYTYLFKIIYSHTNFKKNLEEKIDKILNLKQSEFSQVSDEDLLLLKIIKQTLSRKIKEYNATKIDKKSYCLIKIFLTKYYHDQLNYSFYKDHFTVDYKDKKKTNPSLDFYFCSFKPTIEDFAATQQTNYLPNQTVCGNISVSTIAIYDNSDVKTINFCTNKQFAIGAIFNVNKNFINFLSHETYDGGTLGRAQEIDFDTYKIDGSSINDHVWLARNKGIPIHEAILSNRYFRQIKDIKSRIDFDESLISVQNNYYPDKDGLPTKDQAKAYNKLECLYNIYGYCVSLGRPRKVLDCNTIQHCKHGGKTVKLEDEIKTVIHANNIIRQDKLKIIDYTNNPSFIIIPNNFQAFEELLKLRAKSPNVSAKDIEKIVKKYTNNIDKKNNDLNNTTIQEEEEGDIKEKNNDIDSKTTNTKFDNTHKDINNANTNSPKEINNADTNSPVILTKKSNSNKLNLDKNNNLNNANIKEQEKDIKANNDNIDSKNNTDQFKNTRKDINNSTNRNTNTKKKSSWCCIS